MNTFITKHISTVCILVASLVSVAQAQTTSQTAAKTAAQSAVQTAAQKPTEIAKVWAGQWVDQSGDTSAGLTVDAKGNFAFNGKTYTWVGSKSNLPKQAGCFAYYEGVLSKSTLTQRLSPDTASATVLKNVSDDRFKQIELVCVDSKGDKVKSTDECQSIGFFYDQKAIYRALNCKIGTSNHLMVYPFSKR
jgi:hypothetical protein